jgi:hypothetical protein
MRGHRDTCHSIRSLQRTLINTQYRILQQLDALRQPRQFLVGDFICGGIAGIDIGAIEAGEAAFGEFGIIRSDLGEFRGDLLCLRAQEF